MGLSAFAHDDRDWRTEYLSYLYLDYQFPQSVEEPKFRINVPFYKEKLAVLTGMSPVPGTQEKILERKSIKRLDLARTFLKNEFESLGFKVNLHYFGNGTNIIAEKLGTKSPEKILIVSAHIDSVGNAGANDDGTGVIGMLAIAKELSKKTYDYTIRFVGFDREEKGMAGSEVYAATLQNKSDIIGNINLEMLGHNSKKDGAFHIIDCDSILFANRAPKYGSDKLSAVMKEVIISLKLDLTVVRTCTGRSDHASFWKNKMPAIVISENFFGGDPDPCYHASCDVMDERINYPYIQKILEATLSTVEILISAEK